MTDSAKPAPKKLGSPLKALQQFERHIMSALQHFHLVDQAAEILRDPEKRLKQEDRRRIGELVGSLRTNLHVLRRRARDGQKMLRSVEEAVTAASKA